MFVNFLKSFKLFRVKNAVVAGQTLQTSTTIDCEGATSITAIAALGTITATGVPTLQVQQGDAANGSDAANISGASAVGNDTMSNSLLAVEVVKITKRYVTLTLTRATANIVLDGMFVITGGLRTEPQTPDSTVGAQTVIAPDAF